MKHLRLSAGLRVFTLLATVASLSLLLPHKAIAAPESPDRGATYVTTVTDSTGAFASRGVITLHADRTMSVLDSGQGGPAFFSSSQLGSCASDGKGGLIARTIDFDFPSAGVARLDYTITFHKNGSQISGTITLTDFPLTGNPLDGGGTVLGTFTFTGNLLQP